MILDNEDVLIDNLKHDYISHIDHLYKNHIDLYSFIEDTLKILNEHKFTPYGTWRYQTGVFEFFSYNDPYNISLVSISFYDHRKPMIGFGNIAKSYNLKKYHNITKEDYKKLINEFKQKYGDRADYFGGVILK